MKVIKVIDEDTLEMRDLVIEDGEEVKTASDDISKLSDEAVEAIANSFRQALPCEPEDFAQKYRKYQDAKAEFDTIFNTFKTNIIELHKAQPDLPKSMIICGVRATYVSPSTRLSIDSKKLKEEEPELAKKFTKTSSVNATVRLEDIL